VTVLRACNAICLHRLREVRVHCSNTWTDSQTVSTDAAWGVVAKIACDELRRGVRAVKKALLRPRNCKRDLRHVRGGSTTSLAAAVLDRKGGTLT
jgi:hypothetical protein